MEIAFGSQNHRFMKDGKGLYTNFKDFIQILGSMLIFHLSNRDQGTYQQTPISNAPQVFYY
jgi:hypothetical protein